MIFRYFVNNILRQYKIRDFFEKNGRKMLKKRLLQAGFQRLDTEFFFIAGDESMTGIVL
jgi:hypothetical protein